VRARTPRLLGVTAVLTVAAFVSSVAPSAALAAKPVKPDHANATQAKKPRLGPTAAGPSVVSFSPASTTVSTSALSYTLSFSEPVTGLEAGDFAVSGTSPGWSVSSVTGSSAEYTVAVGTADVVAGTLILTLGQDAVVDGSSNAGPAAPVAAETVTVQPPPELSVAIDGDAASTSDPTLHVGLTAAKLSQGATMRFSLDAGATWTDPEPYAASKDMPLPAKWPWGSLQVDVEVADGGDTKAASDTISYAMAGRSTMALQPTYAIQATLDYTHARLTSHMTVDIVDNDTRAIGFLDFSALARAFGELTVTNAKIDGEAVTPFYPNSADVRLPLGFNLRRTETVTVTIDFVSTASSDITNSLRARFSKANGMMQISSWYPVLSSGHGLRWPGDSQFTVAAPVRLALTHPSDVVIAAPGTLESSTTTTKVFTMAMSREFAFAASPSFKHVALGAGGVTVAAYFLGGAAGSTAAGTAATALTRYSNTYGAYPRTRLIVVQSTRAASANEYSGIVFLGSSNLTSSHLVAHEVGHQWFYDQVGNDQLNAPWLDEAFTEFASRWAFSLGAPSYCSSLKVDSSVYVFPNSPATNDCDGYNQTIYNKGAAFLYGIRSRMGSTPFFRAMRAIVAENRWQIVTTTLVKSTFLRYAPNPTSLSTYMSGFLH
jgi:Peptidase family M1 domain